MEAVPSSPTNTGNIAGHEGIGKPNGTFRGTPYFDCSNGTFSRCIQGKKKHKKWGAFIKETETYNNIKNWQQSSYKNQQTNFILRNSSTGEMVYARNPNG